MMSIFTTDESQQKAERITRALQIAIADATEIYDEHGIEYIVDDVLAAVELIGTERVRDALESFEWSGFTFTKPEPSQSVRFFDDNARRALEELP
jgi:hypothetical protein